eukprot:6421269-Prymnesium_polylepis.1
MADFATGPPPEPQPAGERPGRSGAVTHPAIALLAPACRRRALRVAAASHSHHRRCFHISTLMGPSAGT